MNVDYITQPDTQLGKVLLDMLDADPSPSRIVFVSAFVSVQTVMRVKQQIHELKKSGVNVRFVLGIDLGGTSQEVLKEVLSWSIDVRIVKHRISGHTFHPKLYLFEWADHATIIIGSNNITEGGFFGNYEGAARVDYALPEEADTFRNACGKLARFLQPGGPTAYQLTEELLDKLITRGDLPTEAEARKGRDVAIKANRSTKEKGEPIFGTEDFATPPPLPAELLERLVKDVHARRTAAKKASKKQAAKMKAVAVLPLDEKISDSLLPAAFYMTLPTLQGNIPGEGRIPLEAIELAKEFWGWPDEYSKEISPHAGKNRVYWNWRPKWRIWSVEAPGNVTTQEVRMYMYENSSDFRFYVRPLVNAGGDLGDVVRIRRIAQPDAEYECVLARQGTPEYEEWMRSCTQPVRNKHKELWLRMSVLTLSMES